MTHNHHIMGGGMLDIITNNWYHYRVSRGAGPGAFSVS